MDIARFDYEETVERVMKTHKRKVSQLASLEQELGLYFDEDEAERIAKETMKQMNPNNTDIAKASVDHIVAKARKEHKRKVSQYQAIKHDIGQHFPDPEESAQLAAEVMKEFAPNDYDDAVKRVVGKHKRRVSQLASLEQELGLDFDEDAAVRIAKKTLKEINPNNTASVNVEHIVAKARKEHTRKVSQYQAIKHDIGQHFPDPEESAQLAAEVMKEFAPNDYDDAVKRVVGKHKRRVSRLASLEQELGLDFDEDAAKRIAKQTLKEINPNNTADVSVERIVAKARKEHTRRVSQYQAIKHDIGQHFLDPEESAQLAAEVMKEFAPNDYDDAVKRVVGKHKRKVSQLAALEQDLGLDFDEDEAVRIAKQTLKEINPNNTASVNVEHIVAKARKEHTRKVSQYQAIKHDISQYFPDEDEAGQLAAEVMKEFNPNDRSGKASEITVDSIVERAMTEHKRKKSQYAAIENDLGLVFDKEDVNAITKNVMKKVFAQKHNDDEQGQMGQLGQAHMEQMQQRVNNLKDELAEKNEKILELQMEIKQLAESKKKLAINSNLCLNQMRGYLVQYQQAIMKKD